VLTVRAAVEGRLGNYSEALRYDGLALPILRQLSEGDDPERYAHPLATALSIEARHFYEVGRLSEALACTTQALDRLRTLAGRDEEAASSDLAHTAADRAAILLALDRSDEALAASQEAVAIRLGAHDPDRMRACLALNSLGESLLRQGRSAQALAPLRDGLALARAAATANPRRATPWLVTCLSTLAAALAVDARSIADAGLDSVDKDTAEEALALALEAEQLARSLAETAPAACNGLLALAECSLARAHEALGHAEEARLCAEESVRHYEAASEGRGSRFGVELSRARAVLERLSG
jgi:tetratricopeptide (TPR) repeat protein